MCIGIPMKVVESGGYTALCEVDGARRRVDMTLVGELPVGAWVIVHKDAARSHVSEEEARKVADALKAVERALAGDTDVDDLFPDLGRGAMPLPQSTL
ncbi:MAG: HypC/HybG/HupF family hydrogenase formation chaperone [Nitratireductor sp.]|nr:HypC/HybG/HupF family hydrogenase formation chaperone [Nitratireductor sp.]